MIRLVTKNTFLNTIVCPRLGWLIHKGKLPVEDSADVALRKMEGIEIHRRAQGLFPAGKIISGPMQQALSETGAVIKSNPILFEAAFSADGFGARADILRKTQNGYQLTEVKSGKEIKQDYIDDAAYTAMVLTRSGLKIDTISLMVLSDAYRKGMGNKELFVEEDVKDKVNTRAAEFSSIADHICKTLNSSKAPESKLVLDCKKCPVFQSCTGKGIDHHVLEIPRISEKLLTELSELGIVRIKDIPPSTKLSPTQKPIWKCVCANKPLISPDFKKELQAIIWPAWYLDFETCTTALPVYDDVGPYEQVVTQYSIHMCSGLDAQPEHFEYLADPSGDCRRELAESLVTVLQGNGSIIVYSSFENSIINGLAEAFPELAVPLNKIISRLVDLCAMLRSHYCHPGFKGSYSIKTVLPVMVPELDYSDLAIKEGGSAAAQFAFMAKGQVSNKDEIKIIRQNLLQYCARDTLAMVKLHMAIINITMGKI